jgi:hypothetical protein
MRLEDPSFEGEMDPWRYLDNNAELKDAPHELKLFIEAADTIYSKDPNIAFLRAEILKGLGMVERQIKILHPSAAYHLGPTEVQPDKAP